MKRLKKLLKDNSGESMTELIVSFTIFMLALATLTSMVTLGLKFNRLAADADNAYYADFKSAKATDTSGMKVSVIVDETVFPDVAPPETYISYYYNEAGFIYFEFDTEPAATEPPAEESGAGE